MHIYIAILLLLFSLAIFWQVGISAGRNIRSVEEFFYSRRNLNRNGFIFTFTAGSTSLATVLFFFLTASQMYGGVFLWNTVTFVVGQALFFWVVSKADLDILKFTSLRSLVLYRTKSLILSNLVRLIVSLNLGAVLLIELIIGSSIIGYIFPGIYSEFFGFLALSLITVSYVYAGGFAAVVANDAWQARLMWGAAFLLVFVGIYAATSSNLPTLKIISDGLAYSASERQVWTLIANATIVNLSLPLVQLAGWQRISAVRASDANLQTYLASLTSLALLWLMFIFFALTMSGLGTHFDSINSVMDYIVSLGPVFQLVFFPLVFVGLASALISTADTAAVGLLLALTGRSAWEKEGVWPREKKKMAIVSFFCVVVLGVVYWAIKSNYNDYFLHLLFATFSQAIVIAPLIYLVSRGSYTVNPRAAFFIGFGIFVSFLLVWVFTYIGVTRSDLFYTQLSSIICLTLAAFSTLVGLHFGNRRG